MVGYQKELHIIGSIHKPHGLLGWCRLFLTCSLHKKPYAFFIEQQHTFVPYLVQAIEGKEKDVLVQFYTITNRMKAMPLRNTRAALSARDYQSCIIQDKDSPHRLQGYQVITIQGDYLGVVDTIQQDTQPMLLVTGTYGVVPIPFVLDKIITAIDQSTNTLYVDLADGFLNLFAKS